MITAYFMHRIKHDTSKEGNAAWDKGVEVHEGATADEAHEFALQSYHAYLGAYGYGHSANVDFVSCEITDGIGNRVAFETWNAKETEPNANVE